MTINLNMSQVTLINGKYVTTSFLCDENDSLLTVAATLNVSGTASIEISLDNQTWADVPSSSFTCNLTGIQGFAECQSGIYYRVKTDQVPTKIQIAI